MAEEKTESSKGKPSSDTGKPAEARSGERKQPRTPKAPAGEGAPEGSAKPSSSPKASAEGKAENRPDSSQADGAAKAETVGGVTKQPTAEDLLKEELGAIKVRKAKGSKNITSGFANVLASFNNTIVSITDPKGQVIAWSSA